MSNKSKFKILIWKSRHHFLRICLQLISQQMSCESRVEGQRETVLSVTRQTSQVKIVSEIGLIWLIILTEKDHYFKKREIIFIFS